MIDKFQFFDQNILAIVLAFPMVSCGSATNTNGVPDPDKIVPARELLIGNLEGSGYTVTALVAVEGSDLIVDRVKAQKNDKFIDIVYGLSADEATEIFALYCELYPDGYYILAQNGNFVYCVSDKRTFKERALQRPLTSASNTFITDLHI